MYLMSVLDWFLQYITNCITWLKSVEIVSGLTLLHVLLAFTLMGVVVRVLVPRA